MQGLSKVYFDQFLLHLHMSVYQPVQLKVLVVVPKGVDELLGDLEEAHVEEELEDGEDGDVEVDVDGNPATGHPHILPAVAHTEALDLLATDQGEDEEEVGGKGDHLRIGSRVTTIQAPKTRHPNTKSTLRGMDTQIRDTRGSIPVCTPWGWRPSHSTTTARTWLGTHRIPEHGGDFLLQAENAPSPSLCCFFKDFVVCIGMRAGLITVSSLVTLEHR